MEVTIAKNAGFCPGVRNATERLHHRMENGAQGERIVTLGHLIHNEEYNRGLAARGVRAIAADELASLAATATPDAPITVFVRAHGISREVRAHLEALAAAHEGFSFEDCTCPFVTKIHRIAKDLSQNGGQHTHIFICIGNAAYLN